MHSTWSCRPSLTILILLVSACSHASKPQSPAAPHTVVVPGPCPQADQIPAWHVTTTQLLSAPASKRELMLYARIDVLERHARRVKADCGTHEQIPPVPSPSTTAP